jgi:CubicO group peptidase (beta-lactamase class C family)
VSRRIRIVLVASCLLPWLDGIATPAAAPSIAASWPGKTWEESTPAREGLDEKVIANLDAEIRDGKHGYIDSMLIVRHGRIVFDARYPRDYATINAPLMTDESGPYNYYDLAWHPYYQDTDLHTMQSTTKNLTSALVGIAMSRGELPGVTATLGELLPKRNITDPRKAGITLDNLLTMRSGIEWVEGDAGMESKKDDWISYVLGQPLVADPGTLFNYNSGNTQLLAEIVSVATGRSLQDYAEEVLFGPIGIERYYWKTAPEGYNDGEGGLYLAPRDLARFALYARGGDWDGRQVVPAAWVRESIRTHVNGLILDDPNLRYGYQWWIFEDGAAGRPRMYGTWGWGGQYALVVPDLDLIGVLTGWSVYDDLEHTYRVFYDEIVLPLARAQHEH